MVYLTRTSQRVTVKNVEFDHLLMMPATFGPPLLPEVSTYEYQSTMTLSYSTSRDVATRLLPPCFEPTDEPVLTFMHKMLKGIDYMQGRGYNLLQVELNAVFNGKDGAIERQCPIVIWENNTVPIIAGRELAGNPKIFGEVTDVIEAEDQTAVSFECSEYGTRLVGGTVHGMRELTGERLERLNVSASDASLFGWKFIPGSDGPDVDYPTLIHGSNTFFHAWTGEGRIDFGSPTVREAPTSARIVDILRELPRLEQRRSFYGVGNGTLFRGRCERIY
jgi:acetoacetate decarboxylase